jgi:hypothetical protein
MAQEAVREGGLQQLIQLSDRRATRHSLAVTNRLVEIKAGIER